MCQELREGIYTPLSNQFYAACYKDNKLPAANKQFDGLFEGDLLRRVSCLLSGSTVGLILFVYRLLSLSSMGHRQPTWLLGTL
jgi:hypothetical protein